MSRNSTEAAINTRAITKSPKMRTQAQIEASRRNGAKSRGPVTAEGKRIPAANATVTDWHRRRYRELGMAKVAHATILQEHSGDQFANDLNKEIPSSHTAISISELQENIEAGLITDDFTSPSEFEKFLKQTEPKPGATTTPVAFKNPASRDRQGAVYRAKNLHFKPNLTHPPPRPTTPSTPHQPVSRYPEGNQ
jgi:hypothetical protein